MKPYISHASAGRIRIRHPLFADPDKKVAAQEILINIPGVEDVRQGNQSLLILMDENTDLNEIITQLERNLPGIKIETQNPEKCDHRKCWLRSLLAAGISTVGLAITGPYKLHAWVGTGFALLAAHHVWIRRKRL